MFTTYRIINKESGVVDEATIHVNHYKLDMIKARRMLLILFEEYRNQENVICEIAHHGTKESKTKFFIKRDYTVTVVDLSNILIDFLDDTALEEIRIIEKEWIDEWVKQQQQLNW